LQIDFFIQILKHAIDLKKKIYDSCAEFQESKFLRRFLKK
jgi:hypothetical protein